MCLIETYLQMEKIDTIIKQQQEVTNDKELTKEEKIKDNNNNDEQEDVEKLIDKIEKQNINNNNDDVNDLNQIDNELFQKLFKSFSKFGDTKSMGETITLSNSDKWFKQAKIIDNNNNTNNVNNNKQKITTTDTGIYFKQISKTKKTLNLKEYQQFLEKLSTVKKIDYNELIIKLQNSGLPATNKTTTAVTSGAIGRLTDHTKYTGSHKQRFDESGKGRGKAGRVDIKNNTGYVTGFKSTT